MNQNSPRQLSSDPNAKVPLKYEIGPIWSSERDTDVQLNVFVGNKHFQVDLFTSNFEANPQLLKEYLCHVERSAPDYLPPLTDEEFTDPIEDFYKWAMEPFFTLFRQIPPLDPNKCYTLQDCLFPEKLCYTLQLAGDEVVTVRRDVAAHVRPVGTLLPVSAKLDYSMFIVYSPRDVHVPLDRAAVALPPLPRKVYIEGRVASFFKLVLPGDSSSTLKELSAYAKIHAAQVGANVRVSRLLGVVKDEKTTRIIGLLLSYIDCDHKTLLCAGRGPEHALLRQKWTQQITQSLQELHAHGIVWGDVKPDNVLIDKHDDAYLIDFGGGYTNGWVDNELSNTLEGDLQGLERIVHYTSTVLA
jgi:hypothetical protein